MFFAKKLSIILALLLMSGVLPVTAQEEASRSFFKADYLARQAEQSLAAGDRETATAKFRASAEEFRRLRQSYPRYSPEAVRRNLGAVERRLKQLGASASSSSGRSEPVTQPRSAPAREPRRQAVPQPQPQPQRPRDRQQVSTPAPQVQENATTRDSSPAPSPVSRRPGAARSAALAGASAAVRAVPRRSLGAPLRDLKNATPTASGEIPPRALPAVDIAVHETRSQPAPARKDPVETTGTLVNQGAPAEREEPAGSGGLAMQKRLVAEQNRVIELENELAKLQTELRRLQLDAGDESDGETSDIEERLLNMRRALAEREEQISRSQRELAHMKETRQARLDEEKRETARLKAELEHVKEQLAGLMSGDIVPEDLDQGAISKRLEQLSTERSQYLQENDKLKRQIAALQSKMEKLESDRLPLEEAILTSRAGDVQDEKSELALAKLQEYQKRLEAARQEKMRNLEMIVALKKKLESVQQNTESGTAQDAGKQQQLVEKLEKMNTLLGKAKVRLEQLSSENASLKEQVAAGNESADEATQSLNEQLAQIREENRLLSEDLAARAEEVKDLQAQNEALRENHQMQISAFEDRLAKLETQNAELETLQQEVDRQKELLAAAETEKTQLREQLNNRIESRSEETDETAVAQLRQENQDLSARVEELLAEVESTPEQVDESGEQSERASLFDDGFEEDLKQSMAGTGAETAAETTERSDLTDEETLEVLAVVEEVITDEDPELRDAEAATGSVDPEELAEAAEVMAQETPRDAEEPAEELDLAGAAEDLAANDAADGPAAQTESPTAVDQAFDLKNQGGFPGSLSELGVGSGTNDPFEQAAPEDFDGGPLVATSTPRPAGLDDALAMKAQEATDAFQQNRFAEAERLFEEVVEQDPDNVYALSNLGVVRFKQQKFPEAEEVLEKAVEVDPKDAFSYETLGIVYFSQGKIDDAIDVLTKALSQDDSRWTAHNFLGIAASRKGWPEAAEKELLKAVELNPQYGDAHYNLAVLYATQQPPSLGLAAKHYQRALSLGSSRSVDLERLLDRTELAESGGAN